MTTLVFGHVPSFTNLYLELLPHNNSTAQLASVQWKFLTHSLPFQGTLPDKKNFTLFASLLEVSMINSKYRSQDIHFELSIGE